MMALDTISSRLSLDGYGPAVLVVVAALGLLIWQKAHIKMDPREPPLLRPWIPFVGHLIGMLQYHQRYFEKLRFVTRRHPSWNPTRDLTKVMIASQTALNIQCLPIHSQYSHRRCTSLRRRTCNRLHSARRIWTLTLSWLNSEFEWSTAALKWEGSSDTCPRIQKRCPF
jgi:hypothetical protein